MQQLNNFEKNKIYRAFTLSEILIVISIIGVVAAITIPALINKTNDIQLKNAWRKTYSEIMNVQQKMAADNSSLEDSFDEITFTAQGGTNLQAGWLNYLPATKICEAGKAYTQGCFYSSVNYYDGTNTWNNHIYSTASGAILKDGTLVIFYPGSTGDFSTMNPSNTVSDMYLFFDVNGFKAPNTFGKDVFAINYSPKRKEFVAYGNASACSGMGFNCSSYYLMRD